MSKLTVSVETGQLQLQFQHALRNMIMLRTLFLGFGEVGFANAWVGCGHCRQLKNAGVRRQTMKRRLSQEHTCLSQV